MPTETFTLYHIHSRGPRGRTIYKFDTPEKLEKFYERFSIDYHMFTESLIYNKNDELIHVHFITDSSQFNKWSWCVLKTF